jgi:hypothetical protein
MEGWGMHELENENEDEVDISAQDWTTGNEPDKMPSHRRRRAGYGVDMDSEIYWHICSVGIHASA